MAMAGECNKDIVEVFKSPGKEYSFVTGMVQKTFPFSKA